MTIKQATISNLNDLIPLFDGYRMFYRQESDVQGATQFLNERLLNKDSVIFIAFVEEKAVGFTQLYPMFSSVSMEPFYILNDLYVDVNHRDKGIGKDLIDEAKQLCVSQKYKGLGLQTESNNPAQHLYERLGFNKDLDLHYFWTNTNR